MIDERELRIGSLVYPIINGEVIMNPHAIKGIADKSVYIGGINDSDAAEISFDNICSIPLSKEIISQCGFEKVEIPFANGSGSLFGYGLNNGIVIMLTYNPFNPTCFVEYHYKKEIKHLHQLQNLFLDLSGNELKINIYISQA